MSPTEIAADLRRNAFNTDLASGAAGSDEPFGLINEFRQGDAVVTLAAFRTGDVSLYFSTGGGIIGGVGRAELAQLARETIAELEPIVSQLTRSDETEPPAVDEVCFYVLTPSGRLTARARVTDMVAPNGPIVKLVRLSGALLTKVRQANQSRPPPPRDEGLGPPA